MHPEKNVSVVIPARNAAASISTLLRSLLPDIELIQEILLIDDGSEDATVRLAENTAQRYNLPLFVFQVSFGKAGAARNFGIEQARGRFLFFIDADDELIPGALTILACMLTEAPSAGLAVGACIRRTATRQDKIKIPHGYTADRTRNVALYLANELWPIAMGSAMIVTACTTGVRFPETISLDEDTCYWTALLARVDVVTTTEPVLVYKLDESRMSQRFVQSPRRTLLGISREFRNLTAHGVNTEYLKQRVVWVALRIARQLIMSRRYAVADSIMRLVRAHPRFRLTWDVFRYNCRIKAGMFLQSLGGCKPRPRFRPAEYSGERLRTLIVTVDCAAVPVSGADLRNYQHALSSGKSGPVKVVSIHPGNFEKADRIPGVEFLSAGISGERSASLSSRRCCVETRISRAANHRLLTIVRNFSPDRILMEGIPLAALLKYLRPLTPCLILDMHNIESDLASQRRIRGWGLAGLRAVYDVARIRWLERKALAQVDRVWVCSALDRDRLVKRNASDVSVYVVPNGIPETGIRSSQCPVQAIHCADGPVMLFVGHLGYWPNAAAAGRLVKNILPAVRATFPYAKVILAGRHPNAVVQTFSSVPGVELYANPKSLKALYDRAHIAVVPLSEGGGTRIKILEAIAVGLPVVATAVAIEGLDLIDGEDVLIADSDNGIVRHVIDIWSDFDRRQKLIRSAEQTVKLRFSPEAVDFAVKAGLC